MDRRRTIDWTFLPGELFQLIADKLSTVEDFTVLTSVCRYIRSSIKKDLWRPSQVFQPPWLLPGSGDEETSALSMYAKKKYHIMNLPELRGRHCFGTPYGWIITLGLDLQLHLFNPLNMCRIELPPPKLRDSSISIRIFRLLGFTIYKAILIKRPPFRVDDFLVVACTYDGLLSVARRPQDNTTWETMTLDHNRFRTVQDLAYYKGQIYVIGRNGGISICSNIDSPGSLVVVDYVPNDFDVVFGEFHYAKFHLVVSLGDLLLVIRTKDRMTNSWGRTCAINVFKLNHQTNKWTVVDDLGDQALFVCDSQSMSLSSPETFNCRRNCIYFAQKSFSVILNEEEKDYDMGVFDLKRGTIHPFYGSDGPIATGGNWFIPTFS